MHYDQKCDEFPPAFEDFIELPVGGSFDVELASNRAWTGFSYNGRYTPAWGDGMDHPDDDNVPSCITLSNIHAQNYTMAAGTAFAISYQWHQESFCGEPCHFYSQETYILEANYFLQSSF